MYDLTDAFLAYLFSEYIDLFNSIKSYLISKDEINILQRVNSLYEKLFLITKDALLELAQMQYEYIMQGDYDYSGIDNEWLQEILENFDPVVKYVFVNEVDRKRSRMYESVMSSDTPNDEVDIALKQWCNMVGQISITVTDNATYKAYKDRDELEVVWVTEDDDKRCKECKSLEGKVFKIDEIPPKPHRHCRCYCIPN